MVLETEYRYGLSKVVAASRFRAGNHYSGDELWNTGAEWGFAAESACAKAQTGTLKPDAPRRRSFEKS